MGLPRARPMPVCILKVEFTIQNGKAWLSCNIVLLDASLMYEDSAAL
jgi:hypothetical protein